MKQTSQPAPDTDVKETARLCGRPMAAPPPADEIRVTQHLLHSEFGRRLAYLVIRRGAKLALGLNTANMPVKDKVTSLAGSIDSVFIAEAVRL